MNDTEVNLSQLDDDELYFAFASGVSGALEEMLNRDSNATKAFDPNQERDEHGRWTSGGSFDGSTPPPVIGQEGVWQSKYAPPGQIPWVVNGKQDYIKAHGFPVRDIDYKQIAADPVRAKQIADAYDKMPSYSNDPEVKQAYEALRSEVKEQYDYMTNVMGVSVSVTDSDPYKNAYELQKDLTDNHHISVLSTESTGGHPFFTNEENDMFRAVHDTFGHMGAGTGFDRNGEEASFVSHYQMFSPDASKALATETRGQNSWLTYSGKDTFAEQKFALLPEAMTQPYKNEGQQSKSVAGTDEARSLRLYGVANPTLGRHLARGFKSFNPDQARDEHGRWSDGGGSHVEAFKGNDELLKSLSNAALNPDGGFSIHVANGSEPTTGYMVSRVAGGMKVDAPDIDSSMAAIRAFATDNAATLASDKTIYAGGWRNPDDGKLYLDLTDNVADEAIARDLGQQRDQISIYDVVAGETIDTHGSGGANAAPGSDRNPDELYGKGTLVANSATKAYNPDQPRDDHGRWGEGNATDLSPKHLARLQSEVDPTSDQAAQLKSLIIAKGFDSKPQLVKSVNSLSGTPIYRGVTGSMPPYTKLSASEMVDAFKTGDMYVGHGQFGNGVYFTTDKSLADRYADPEEEMSSDGTGAVMTAAILPEAKILTVSSDSAERATICQTLSDAFPQELGGVLDQSDLGTLAACSGYDVINVHNETRDVFIVLNRGILQVVDK